MIQELLYTADSKGGLKGGGSGYSTVLSTEGMASNLAQALERLSGYKHPFDIHDPRAQQITVNYRHAKIRVGGIAHHVLSRIADLRLSNTGRSNKLAHHVVLPSIALPVGGPSLVFTQKGFCRTEWDGQVTLVPAIPVSSLPSYDFPAAPCTTWQAATGDAGWAGYAAEHLLSKPQSALSVIFLLGTDTLALTNEVFSLLPPNERWEVTFSTYFTSLPAGISCSLRFYLDGTPEAEHLRRDYRQTIIDLAEELGAPPESDWVKRARTGVAHDLESAPKSTQSDPGDKELSSNEESPHQVKPAFGSEQEESEDLELLQEDLRPIPTSSMPPWTDQQDLPLHGSSTPQLTLGAHFLRLIKKYKKVALVGFLVVLCGFLFVGGILFGLWRVKGGGPATLAQNTNTPRLETDGVSLTEEQKQQSKSATDDSATNGSGSDSSEPAPQEDSKHENEEDDSSGKSDPYQRDVDQSLPEQHGDSDSKKESTETPEEHAPIKLEMFLPYLKSPDSRATAKDNYSQKVSAEFPADWLSSESTVHLVQIGLDKLDNPVPGRVLSLHEPEVDGPKRKWILQYKGNAEGAIGRNVPVLIADLWIEENQFFFQWNDRNLRNQLELKGQRALFNGIRWCLLKATIAGKSPIVLRLSEPERLHKITLISNKSERNLSELKNEDEDYVLPVERLLFFSADIQPKPPEDIQLKPDRQLKRSRTFVISYYPSESKDNSHGNKAQVKRLLSIEIQLKARNTLAKCSVDVSCTLHLPRQELETIKNLYEDPPLFKRDNTISDNSSVDKYIRHIDIGRELIQENLADIKKKIKEKGEANAESKKLDEWKSKLNNARNWCEAAQAALRYLQQASATVTLGVDYSSDNPEDPYQPRVKILSSM